MKNRSNTRECVHEASFSDFVIFWNVWALFISRETIACLDGLRVLSIWLILGHLMHRQHLIELKRFMRFSQIQFVSLDVMH